MIHSFLLIGQSNAGGRGFKDEVEPIDNPDLNVLRNGRWRKMYTPVNPDRVTSGVCLIESFAQKYCETHNVQVGIIPCADGGSSLDQWCEGSLLYDHAVYMAKLAQRTSTIAGVLWHQGESDCEEELYPLYEEKFSAIVKALRRDLNLYDVPFLVGGLGDYLKDWKPGSAIDNYYKVNEALENIAEKDKMMGFVSARGLTPNPDNMHFNARSLREFGLRYYDEFEKLEDKNKVFEEKSTQDAAIRNALEEL